LRMTHMMVGGRVKRILGHFSSSSVENDPCLANELTQGQSISGTADIEKFIQGALKAQGVNGASLALLDGDSTVDVCVGLANVEQKQPMTPDTWLQCASLSKTVGTAFALEYFSSKNIPFTTPVNSLLEKAGASFRLRAKGGPDSWADSLQLKHLVNHTALGMHYVYGIPPSKPEGMPTALDLLEGRHEKEHGYAALFVEKAPGSKFHYSGGGYLVLQLLLEAMEKKPIYQVMASFLAAAGVASGFSFEQQQLEGNTHACAHGYYDNGERVQDGRLMFPPLAAGGHCTPNALLRFLRHLAIAYKSPTGSGPVSHHTAVEMLENHNTDKGCFEFMHSQMGLGVFIVKAGANRFMLHQAANDGFRGLYLICFDGPDASHGPRGFVLLSNGDNQAMFANCHISRFVLKETFKFQGMDWQSVEGNSFSKDGVAQEQIVNLGLKELVLKAFRQD